MTIVDGCNDLLLYSGKPSIVLRLDREINHPALQGQGQASR
jgi:hypothetical protein